MPKTIAQIITKDENIKSLDYPFQNLIKEGNKFFKNDEHKMNIRIQNLHDIIDVFKENNIVCWPQGKTLLGIYKYKKLIKNDTDEDIGTSINNLELVCEKILPKLIEKGFKIIRATKNNSMVSLLRNYRYVDICFFKIKDNYIGYEHKKFPIRFYQDFENLTINNYEYTVPKLSTEIIKYSYNI